MNENKHLLENPGYIKNFRFKEKLPEKFRIWFKSVKLPLLLDWFRWIIIDTARPSYFHPYGMYFITGLPGYGKTMMMTHKLNQYRAKYKNDIIICTNYGYKYQDFAINSYKDLIKIYDKPVIVGYDEIQNDFDARQWESIDREFAARITQSRKVNGMMILCTAQKFGFVDRRLRQLTHRVFECRMVGKRLTFARIYEPQIQEKIEAGEYGESNVQHNIGITFMVQSDNIRESYNSYNIIKSSAMYELEVSKIKEQLKTASPVPAFAGLD